MMTNYLLGYIGPGPGVNFLWAFVALIGTVCLALFSVLLWPIRMLIRRVRGTPADDQTQSQTPPPTDDAAGPQ
jgi:hypothetical protein